MNIDTITSRYGRFAFLIPLGLSLFIITHFYHLPGITADGHIYLQIARNIRYGIGLGWQALWCPPMHSILIALASWLPGVPNIHAAAGIVSPLMGILLPLAVYFLAVGLFSRPVAVAAALITAVFPQFIFLSFSTDIEITYTVFLMTALALLVETARKEKYLPAVFAGVFFSLAYQTRSEGFLIMLFTLAILCATEGLHFYKSALLKCCIVVLVVFFVVSAPYLVFLKKHYGALVISPKATYVLLWMKSSVYKDNNKGEQSNDELWGLTPDGKYAWQHPSGLGDVVRYLMTHPQKSLDVYLTNLMEEIPGRIPNNSGCLHYPQTYPLYLVLPAMLMAFRRWGENSTHGKAILFSPFLILLILPVFTGGWWKYLVPYAPLIFIAGCAGVFRIVECISKRCGFGNGVRTASVIVVLFSSLLAGHYFAIRSEKPTPANTGVQPERYIFAEETRLAGEMARKQFGAGRHYMVPWSKMIYYLDGLWTATPVTDHDGILQFARRNNVEYIVTDEDFSFNNDQRLKLAAVYMSPRVDYTVAFYQVLH